MHKKIHSKVSLLQITWKTMHFKAARHGGRKKGKGKRETSLLRNLRTIFLTKSNFHHTRLVSLFAHDLSLFEIASKVLPFCGGPKREIKKGDARRCTHRTQKSSNQQHNHFDHNLPTYSQLIQNTDNSYS